MRHHPVPVLVLSLFATLACFAQQPADPPPPKPKPVAELWDRGIFDVYRTGLRAVLEEFSVYRVQGGGWGFRGTVKSALENMDAKEVDRWVLVGSAEYGVRGVESYSMQGSYPTGKGEISVQRNGGQVTVTRTMPNEPRVTKQFNLPVDGLVFDRMQLHHWAIVPHLQFPPDGGTRTRQALDPEFNRVAEIRFSKEYPEVIEKQDRSLLVKRILATQGQIGTNLWFTEDNRLVRIEAPHYAFYAVRRGYQGTPVERRPKPAPPMPAGVATQIKDGRDILVGELVLPPGAGHFPAVILLGDAGLQDRDGNPPLGFQLFHWDLQRDFAAGLAARGIATLRWDDCGAGSFTPKEFPTLTDAISNARAAVKWLKAQAGVDPAKIGAIGFGEGSLIALQLLANGELAFGINVSGHGTTFEKVFLWQFENDLARLGEDPIRVKEGLDWWKKAYELMQDKSIKDWGPPQVPPDYFGMGMMRPHFLDIMSYDPIALAAKLQAPILLVHGDADFQIPLSQFEAMKKALTDAKKAAEFVVLPGVDHLMMPVVNGEPGDSADSRRRVDPTATGAVADWILKR